MIYENEKIYGHDKSGPALQEIVARHMAFSRELGSARIGGFTDPEGSRTGIGVLLVGVNDEEHLRLAGKVGTGFTADVLTELRRRLIFSSGRNVPSRPGHPDGSAVMLTG